ncbi:uncharacterized protein LOC131225403 [Magnolia sinica]|uniref:uncharacterized protein LOC131225403 n=1 Tax=Magnolia sinica TaxID=86752 RepID=UPI00265A6F43|nr:uncharacterized protein LOC131225403 [Magnolia sinica]
MGNYISRRTCAIAGKVILTDGSVHKFDEPLSVAELMLDHPQQFVIEFQSIVAGHRPAPLPADQMLEIDKVYLMLPMKRGKAAAFSVDETRRIMDWARFALGSRSFSTTGRILTLLAAVCPMARGKGEETMLRRKDGLVEKEEEGEGPEFLPENLDGRPEFSSRQLSGKGWKPALDTIKEKGIEKKVSHWLFHVG